MAHSGPRVTDTHTDSSVSIPAVLFPALFKLYRTGRIEMTMRRWTVGGTLALGVVGAALGASPASAAQVNANPAEGYASVDLSPAETVVLANTPVPDWIDQVSTPQHQFVDPAWYSSTPEFQDRNGGWHSYYTFAELWREAARHPGGSVTVWVTDPARFDGFTVQLRQY
ncbi:hypothetical protein NSK11_contig00120-0002 [Nocardia seriolae]|uniref:Uncharacterized protein n=1 Tax=Nocardia seriolae TaxID=37332 RepID=A0ABC9Z1Z9_9NOCA|nr:hypothetical protein NSERKGN1266_65810 [Nocardia seriolae]BEK93648.1 hypothetical protein NSER024013_15540 [Nocardia seriolae]GAM49636.1 hypothetical protein NS07_v2contig00117-0002 [Nocardia seriolae]GAP31596.1 hypothetical protein NSK11_contig00120-0002 [Nocardia seriolae]GEM27281.1 hypothetical protein NS2_55200 [Nocardia seriolae NBRC 15557]